jgi:predicted enzyme related to lactoylglutathione lyase
MDLLVNIDVDDLTKAIDFYRRGVGLQVGRRLGTWAVEMKGASTPVWLLLKNAGTKPTVASHDVRCYARHWTPVHLDFVVDDIEASVNRAVEGGASAESEIQTHDWGRIAHMADPFGHGICLIQFMGRGYDQIAD